MNGIIRWRSRGEHALPSGGPWGRVWEWTELVSVSVKWGVGTLAILGLVFAASGLPRANAATVSPESSVRAYAGSLVLNQTGTEFYRDSAPQSFNGGNCTSWEPKESVTTMGDGDLNLWSSGDTWDNGANGSCAEVTTGRLWKTGVFEARIYVPGVDGKIADWPAWWFADPSAWPQAGEIDVFEGLQGVDNTSYHYGPAGATYANGEVISHGFSEPAVKPGWHTFDLVWSPKWARVYVDNKYMGEFSGSYFQPSDEQMIFDITSSAQEDPNGVGTSANMLIQYVRVWKFD